MTKQQQNNQQQQQPVNEADRIRARKRQVIDTLNDKFSQPVWRDRLLKICGGDESRIMKALNSFITYIMNDDGGKEDRKSYIADCTLASISTAFLEAFQMGIEVGGGRDHAYLVKYDNQCELDISYKGFVYALNKHFDNAFVIAACVFEGDDFTCEITDSTATYTHKPKNAFEQTWDKMQGCYCYFSYTLRDGGGKVSRLIMIPKGKDAKSPDSLEMIRSKAKGSWAWKDFPFEQSKKSTMRRASKIPFASIDFGDEDVNPEQVDNRHYQLEHNSGDKLALMMEKHKEMLEDEKKPDEPKKPGKAPADANAPHADGQQAGAASGEAGAPAQAPAPAPAAAPVASPEHGDGGAGQDARRYEDLSDADFGEPVAPGQVIEHPPVTSSFSPSNEEEKQEVLPPENPDAWDGKTLIIGGRPQVNDFPGAGAAAIYLKKVMSSRKHKASRLGIINENPKLIAALVKAKLQGHIDDMHKLAQQGE